MLSYEHITLTILDEQCNYRKMQMLNCKIQEINVHSCKM